MIKKIKHIVKLVWEKSFTKIDTTYKTNLYTITQTQTSFKLTPKLINPVNIDINTNYNDDFIKADNTISKFISEKDTHGIVILNGMMGTGKTYYIRHLIESNPDVNFILGTRSIAESLSEPSFISFLSENTNSVLILSGKMSAYSKLGPISLRSSESISLWNTTQWGLPTPRQVML